VRSLRRLGITEKSDERILGVGNSLMPSPKMPLTERRNEAVRRIEAVCRENHVNIRALQSGSRTHDVARARSVLSQTLVKELGLSLAETARHLGVTTAAIAAALKRNQTKVYLV
jgi:hypothetical protein